VPFYDATLDISNLTVDWPLGDFPNLSWTAPARTPQSILAYRQINDDPTVTADWNLANVVGVLGATATTFTDDTAQRDGSEHFYWIVAIDPALDVAGNNLGVLTCQNSSTYLTTITAAVPFEGPEMDFTQKFEATGAFHSTFNGSASFTPGIPAPPVFGHNEVHMAGAMRVSYTPFSGPAYYDIQLTLGAGPGPIWDVASGFGAVILTEADGLANPIIDPVAVTTRINHCVSTADFAGNWGALPPPPGNHYAVAPMQSVMQLSYSSPPGGSALVGGGGGTGTPPPAARAHPASLLNSLMPVSTPLPAVPCCKTAAPCACEDGGL
jgi:hypothetical protein